MTLTLYQIDPGEHEFYVGVERGTDRLAVSCLQVLISRIHGERWIIQISFRVTISVRDCLFHRRILIVLKRYTSQSSENSLDLYSKLCNVQIKLVVVKMESESNCDTRDQMVRVQEQIAEVWLNKQISL